MGAPRDARSCASSVAPSSKRRKGGKGLSASPPPKGTSRSRIARALLEAERAELETDVPQTLENLPSASSAEAPKPAQAEGTSSEGRALYAPGSAGGEGRGGEPSLDEGDIRVVFEEGPMGMRLAPPPVAPIGAVVIGVDRGGQAERGGQGRLPGTANMGSPVEGHRGTADRAG